MASGRKFLGAYRMVRLIRAGATCQVWEAIRDSQRVAIKYLQPEMRSNREEIGYLKHELEVGQDLRHPNVVEIYEYNVDRSMAFLVMEYHPGQNMKMMIRRGVDTFAHLTPKIIFQAASGLEYLHEQGWVHRDIKPDNFLVNEAGELKLIDFALATRIRTGVAKLLWGRTKVQGTRSYMSPEQIRGKALDARADIYSFGCMLYELVSGRPPFTGATPEELLRKHLFAPIPALSSVNKNITPDFSDLVAMTMAKEPSGRPATMNDFIAHYRGIRVFRSTPKPPAGQEEISAS